MLIGPSNEINDSSGSAYGPITVRGQLPRALQSLTSVQYSDTQNVACAWTCRPNAKTINCFYGHWSKSLATVLIKLPGRFEEGLRLQRHLNRTCENGNEGSNSR